MPLSIFRTIAITAWIFSASLPIARGATIYESIESPVFVGYGIADIEWGDEINLAGEERTAIELLLGLAGWAGPGTSDIMASIYENDGPAGEPGTLLWETSLDDVQFSVNFPFLTYVSFPIPSVTVPDTITWTVEFSDVAGGPDFAVLVGELVGPPSIGSSAPWYWFHDQGSWHRFDSPGDETFAARLTAVPEPTTLSLLLLGVIVALKRRR